MVDIKIPLNSVNFYRKGLKKETNYNITYTTLNAMGIANFPPPEEKTELTPELQTQFFLLQAV